MSTLFLLIALWHLLMPTPAVLGFTPSLRDVASTFLFSPYKIIFMNSEKRGQVDSAPYEAKEKLETPRVDAEREEATVSVVQAEPEGEKTQGREEKKTGKTLKTGVATDGNAEKAAITAADVATVEEVSKPTEEVSKPTEEVRKKRKTNRGKKVSKPTEKVSKPTEKVSKPTEKVSKPTEKVSKPTEKVSKPTEKVSKPTEKVSKPTEEVTIVEEAAEPAKDAVTVEEAEGKSNESAAHVDSPLKEGKYLFFWRQRSNKDKKKETNKKGSNGESQEKDKKKLPTTFLLPGIGGSTLIAEYKDAMIHSCSSSVLNSKPFRLWVSLTRLFSITSNVYCTFDTLRLIYDSEKKMYSNQPGVNITVEDYGRLKGVDYLDYINNTGIGVTKYYNTIASHFLSKGYVEGESIIGAPYDWRYPLYQQDYNLFKETIEATYERRNGMKVNLVGHSLGGLFINYFLVHIVDKDWKAKYLNSVLYMSSPFKGTVKTIRALLHGNRDFVSFKFQKLIKLSISDSMMKAIGNSIGSLYDLIPYKEYYDHDQVVIIMNTDSVPIDDNHMQSIVTSCGIYNKDCYLNRTDVKLKVHTLSDWHVLLKDDLMEKYNNHKPYRDRHFLMDHGIPIYCVYSSLRNKTTDYLLFFQRENLNDEPIVYYGIGDGTVPIESLEACNSFYNAKEKKHFKNYSHIGILHSAESVNYVYDLMQTKEEKLDDASEAAKTELTVQGSVKGINVAEDEFSKVSHQEKGNEEMVKVAGIRVK
ncbi:Phosphatidylcholine-sterol acyltransferase [Plasmodium coatneyi]|uniref:Phosphatidylcholine-sterol acyltransferase n=1 Tax=Plasmodium coatneyi TaxID=208452 RepID=A0A1B1E2Q7_9APIC|nr:Phosphatidylcholine-sterol acyltransferase [Plasmodium coatneyi]ANQ09139.1 Phosphatidylcholine-sterol acyltransferase [Plasmodium coatneyi]